MRYSSRKSSRAYARLGASASSCILILYCSAKDTDIAEHIRLPPKLVRTTLQKLKRDGLVFERSQKQAAGAKKSSVFLWGFDHDKFPRVFRYRMCTNSRT